MEPTSFDTRAFFFTVKVFVFVGLFITGVRFGAGMKQMFTENWVIQGQFGYTWFQTKTYNHFAGVTSTVKPRLASMLFTVGYLF